MIESGHPDIVGDIWVGVMLPAKTPKEIVATLNREFTAVLGMPETRERLATVGFEPVASTPEAFAAQIESEMESWRKVILAARIKVQ